MFPVSAHLNSLIAILCFISGIISILCGLSLLGDDRALNRELLSSCLASLGVNNIGEGLYLTGFYATAESVKTVALVCTITAGILSLELIRRYKKTRRKKMLERGEKP